MRAATAACALALMSVPAFADCDPVPDPVVVLSHGSRYQDDSATRSDIDAKANAEVEAALDPVDGFVSDLARQASKAAELAAEGKPEEARARADCVLSGLAAWAGADALSALDTVNARLSVPSRIGGAAFAFALAQPLATPDLEREALVMGWFTRRAAQIMAFFDDPATPPRAARNNLRAWAALAVLRIGLEAKDPAMQQWADDSLRVMLCGANPDGSLPLEMQRGELSLHYQWHAVAPLVVGTALLARAGRPIAAECDNALARVVGFSVAAARDPSLAAAWAGVPQDHVPGLDSLKPHELAWIPAWQSLGLAPDLTSLVPPGMPLSHSKLGGNQGLIWGNGAADTGSMGQ